ncbi:type VI secretion system lipoprotein TssJ [Methylobacterium sp. NEAU 140]|uniref:type VI secretion system lipoprotein TssJ n=1 Tax=Methylobacterium sp. NEAU 140 TaxID=3064945 RepID=UPI002732B389|nr:type VI secretion system lipoprotein TssJ [Methylobacterium sp. NEAU 140]MDP4025134.1 type VI secretion system lipoprotein TssJ [Methylobacterium sp. NEAU 140]
MRTGLIRRRELLVGMAGLGTLLTSCMEKKEPPPLEIDIKPAAGQTVDFLIEASPLINPDAENNPAPVVVRIYLLASQTAFVNANFFQLWEKDEATLGSASLSRYETVLPPSGVRHIAAKLVDGTALIGVTVGFRDYRAAKWRALVPFVGDRTLKVKVQITTKSVAVVPQE